ncbi:MAG: methyltransferase domain-containing protein [Candidatus Omnitrophota bacterium]
MSISAVKKKLGDAGVNVKPVVLWLREFSLKQAVRETKRGDLLEKLRMIVPDEEITGQEFSEKTDTSVSRLKRRVLHSFQCSLMLKALESLPKGRLTVVDIGDSAGTHMRYLSKLTEDKFDIDTISVNLDERAIERIKARGMEAVHCRAEELNLGNTPIDLFTSFQMVEHLHNPSIFFRRLAKKSKGERVLLTVPYVKKSRVGLHHLRNGFCHPIRAEEEHIFELNPNDWTLLFLHSGWSVKHSEIYYQYPKKWPVLSWIWAKFWKLTDYEGFWGAILEKDTTYSDCYQDWEE